MICQKCQTVNEDSAKFCGHCGAPLNAEELPIITKDIETKLKEEKSSSKSRLLPIVIVALVVLLAIFLFMKGCGGDKGMTCATNDDETFKVKYTAYEKDGKVNKVLVEMDEIDNTGILDEEAIKIISGLMQEEKDYVKDIDGVTLNYKVETKDEVRLHIDAVLELDKISDDYMGSMFIPYNSMWKEMTMEEFKTYIEAMGNISCE